MHEEFGKKNVTEGSHFKDLEAIGGKIKNVMKIIICRIDWIRSVTDQSVNTGANP